MLGHKIDRLKVPFLKPIDDSDAARETTLIARWGRFVTSHAKPVFVILLLVGVALAATSALVRLGASDQGTQPTQQTARRAYDLLAEGFGPGFNGPIPIVVDVNGDAQAPQRVYDGVRDLQGVASASEPQFNDPKTVAIVFVKPASAPQDEETAKLVDRLRTDWVFNFSAVMALMAPVILIGGMTMGWFTPTERRGGGDLGAVPRPRALPLDDDEDTCRGHLRHHRDDRVGAVHRDRRVDLRLAADDDAAARRSPTGPRHDSNKWVFLLLANLLILFVGCFIDTIAAITILVPILLPIVTKLASTRSTWG